MERAARAHQRDELVASAGPVIADRPAVSISTASCLTPQRPLEPIRERLAGELLGDVELKPPAGVLDELHRRDQLARVPARVGAELAPAGRCCGRARRRPTRGREVGIPQRDQPAARDPARPSQPAAASADPLRPLGLDALSLLARVQLESRPSPAPRARPRPASPRARTAASISSQGRRPSPRREAPHARSCSAAARSAAPSADRELAAPRSGSPSARRAQASGGLRRDAELLDAERHRPRSMGRRTGRAGSASGSSAAPRASRSVSRIRCTNEAGSSSVLNIRLAASSPSSSTRSITNTRRADSNGVRLAAATTGSSMSLTRISWAPLGTTHVRSGCDARSARRTRAVGIREPPAQQLGRHRSRRGALAGAAGPVEQVRVRSRRPSSAPGASDGAGVRMSVELGQHRFDASRRGRTSNRQRMQRGRLITIEGIDGAGKTTLASRSRRWRCATAAIDVRLLREPGGVRRFRADSRARQRPAAADRRSGRGACSTRPRARSSSSRRSSRCSSRGRWVLLDRFVDSSLAYQGAGRELGIDAVRQVNEFATGGLTPDRTLLLTVDPRTGRARSRARPSRPTAWRPRATTFFAGSRPPTWSSRPPTRARSARSTRRSRPSRSWPRPSPRARRSTSE